MAALHSLDVRTRERAQFVDITALVQEAVSRSGIASGLCVVYSPHTTAGITLNENADPDVQSDILGHLGKVVPASAGFAHAEGNSDSHIKAAIMGLSQTVLVEGGRLVLGTWQAIYFCEFDGPRNRKVHVKIVAG